MPLGSILVANLQIPSLVVGRGPDRFEPHSLVRFRGMVQDTSYSPEMYLATEDIGGSTQVAGWGLGSSQEVSAENMDSLRDCTVLWATTPPGESYWVSDSTTRHSAS